MRPERSSSALRKQKAPGWSASELRCPRSAPEDGSGEDALGSAGLLRPLPMGADACAARGGGGTSSGRDRPAGKQPARAGNARGTPTPIFRKVARRALQIEMGACSSAARPEASAEKYLRRWMDKARRRIRRIARSNCTRRTCRCRCRAPPSPRRPSRTSPWKRRRARPCSRRRAKAEHAR